MADIEAALTKIGRFATRADFDLSDTAINTMRLGVVDAFGCIVAGSALPTAVKARTAMAAQGLSAGSAQIFGTGSTAPPATAALLNATAGHASEFDDWEVPGNTHPTVVMLPALLACCMDTTWGRDLAAAYAVGFEVIARLGEAMNYDHYDRGWHATATLGALGATAAVARLQGLTATEATNALSLAISRTAGYTCQIGSDAKALQAGFASETAVTAVSLAQSGLTGQTHALDHDKGMVAQMASAAPEKLHQAIGRMAPGAALETHGLVLKPWPTCGYSHRLMTCAVALHERMAGAAAIQHIDLHLPDFHASIMGAGHPRNRHEALFSLPFVVAMGLAHGGLTLRDLAEERWADREIMRLIDKTRVHRFSPVRPDLNYDADQPDRLVITMEGGAELETACAYPLGAPQKTMTLAQVREKFLSCVPGVSPTTASVLMDWPEHAAVAELFARALRI